MGTPEERLESLGLAVPDVVAPLAAYTPAVRSGSHVWTAGQLPLRDGELLAAGLVGGDVDEETATECARQCALNALAAVRSVTGDLSQVVRVVKLVVFVASAPGFTAQPKVADGASSLVGEAFGDAGVHARSAVGVAVLPRNAPVEVELVAEVR